MSTPGRHWNQYQTAVQTAVRQTKFPRADCGTWINQTTANVYSAVTHRQCWMPVLSLQSRNGLHYSDQDYFIILLNMFLRTYDSKHNRLWKQKRQTAMPPRNRVLGNKNSTHAMFETDISLDLFYITLASFWKYISFIFSSLTDISWFIFHTTLANFWKIFHSSFLTENSWYVFHITLISSSKIFHLFIHF